MKVRISGSSSLIEGEQGGILQGENGKAGGQGIADGDGAIGRAVIFDLVEFLANESKQGIGIEMLTGGRGAGSNGGSENFSYHGIP